MELMIKYFYVISLFYMYSARDIGFPICLHPKWGGGNVAFGKKYKKSFQKGIKMTFFNLKRIMKEYISFYPRGLYSSPPPSQHVLDLKSCK